MRRREALVLLGAAAVWPVAARAQQTAIPVLAMPNGQSAEHYWYLAEAVQRGLKDEGLVEGKQILIEHRWAEGHDERLPAMAVELVNRGVAALVTGGSLWATISAKAATATIPIVFTTASDPVKLGFVTALNRPGGNVTGVTFLASQLVVKRLELAAQLVSKGAIIGFLGRPREPRYAADRKNIEVAAAASRQKILFLDISSERELESAFSAAVGEHVGALIPMNDPFFNSHRKTLVELAARYALPAVYEARDAVTAGGLMSYGTSITGAYHQAGVYAARILKGEKAGDLPVVQSTRFELIVNLKTAKSLGVAIPQSLLGVADEVLE
jgi:putative ABC transport system substrate-binding protein